MSLWSVPAFAGKGGGVDAYLLASAERSLSAAGAAQAQQRGLRVTSVEGRVGVPAFVFAERALASAEAVAAPARALTRSEADATAREHLRGVADLYRLRAADVEGAELRAIHMPRGGKGALVAQYGRRVGGVEVFRSEVKVVMDAAGQLVAISGYLAPPNPTDAANAQPLAFRSTGPQAIATAFSNLTGVALDPRALSPAGSKGEYAEYAVAGGSYNGMAFGSPPRAKKVMFALPDELVPAYYVEVNAGPRGSKDGEYMAYVVSARDGQVLFKTDLTSHVDFSYRTYAGASDRIPLDGPQGNALTPHPTGVPDGTQPSAWVPQELVTLQNYPFSRNDAWLPPGATQTTGNNVDAYADLGGSDGFSAETDFRASITAPGVFDYQFDPTTRPDTDAQRRAAIVNLFYINNFLHDWFYDAGFDEASGNAQASNYGRGGLEGDSLRVEAQDFSGRNNANMSTPADGARPRMQMYVFDGVPSLGVTAPAALARSYGAGTGAFGAQLFQLTGELGILDNTGDTNGTTTACTALPAGSFEGKVALVDRGVCGFAVKAKVAQDAGAIGVIVANNDSANPDALLNMGGADATVTIPAMLVSYNTGTAWKTEARTNGSAITVRMERSRDLDRDGTVDNGIVAHEWGHYISNRLVGNATGLSNNMGRAMGEGWADFVAMLMQVREEDRNVAGNNMYQGVYTVAGWTQGGGVNNGYYYGIRRVPYTTDANKNALRLRHIALGSALPTHPMGGGSPTSNSQVHNSGEVWASMLWECYASLLNAYPFAEAQDRMKQYLVASWKLTPSQPTYLEARDAVLAAALASDPADYQRFVNAFARRGAGFGAKVPDRAVTDHVGVVESYETGNAIEVVRVAVNDAAVGCDKDGVLDLGETGELLVTLRNVGGADLPSFTASAAASNATATVAFPSGNTLNVPAMARGATVTARLPVQLTAVATSGASTLGVTLTLNEASLPAAQRTLSADMAVHYDEVAASAATDTMETVASAWLGSYLSPNSIWKRDGADANRYWHATNRSTQVDEALTTPFIQVAATGNFSVSFDYRHSFEATSGSSAPFYDGAVMELSVDGGPWTDLWDVGLQPGYTAFLDAGNPSIGGQPAFAGLSAGFPAWRTSTLDFGTALAGRTVQLRLRVATDSEAGAYGMDLDNVQVTGAVNTPFTSRVLETSDGTTCNTRPVAEAGTSQDVPEATVSGSVRTPRVVTLNGTASFDPDGQDLSYQWTQVGGPAVTLTGATTAQPTFSANVSQDTVLSFQLTVNDGVESSLPKLAQVLVRNVNRAPVAVAGVLNGGPTTVDERSGTVTLTAAGSSDPDHNDPAPVALTTTWTQTAGPTVTLDDASSATPSFTPPEVAADTALTFQLEVSDGEATTTAPLTITVRQVDRAPVADAGADQEVKARSTVQLAGTASDPDGDAVTGWTWTQSSGPEVTLTGADTATPSFTAPHVTSSTVLRFSAVATAGGLPSLPSSVDVTVTRFNRKPVAAPAGPASVEERGAVTLTSAGSADADGDAFTYQWTQVGGPPVTLTGATSDTASFTAPDVTGNTVLLFRLVLSDDVEAGEPADVAVQVTNVNRAPSARASVSGRGTEGHTVSLNAAGSSDPDSQTLTYRWEQTGGPSVALVDGTSAVASFVVPDAKKGTTATFKVTVTDPDGASATADVSVPLGVSAGGCSTSGGGASNVAPALMLLLGFGLLRRRRIV